MIDTSSDCQCVSAYCGYCVCVCGWVGEWVLTWYFSILQSCAVDIKDKLVLIAVYVIVTVISRSLYPMRLLSPNRLCVLVSVYLSVCLSVCACLCVYVCACVQPSTLTSKG